MKKIICFCLSFCIMISVIGCAKKAKPVTINGLYTINAEVQLGEFEATVGLNRLGNGVWDINFSKPDNINGLSVSYQDENAKITYNGLSFSVPRENIPVEAIVTNLTSILDKVAYGNEIEFTKKNGTITAKGKTDNGNYKVLFDEKSGKLLSVELEDIDLKADFTDYKPMG